MRNTLNDVIALVENVIVTGKNRDWEKVVETVCLLKADIYGVRNMVSESAWDNVYCKMLHTLEILKDYDKCYDCLSVDECYIAYLQNLINELKVLNVIKNTNIWL